MKLPEEPKTEKLDELILQSKALTAVDCSIMITDREGSIIWVNPAFSKSTGYTAEEILGRTPRILKSGSHSRAYYTQFWDTVLSGKTWRGEFVNRRRDGALCVQVQTTTPIRWQTSGPITHFISVSEDITHNRKGEVDLRESQSLDTVGQFAAGVAEHFDDLLTVIRANSQLLLEPSGGLSPDARCLVERTLNASRRAERLIRQLIGFSQKQTFTFQAQDFNRIAEHSFQLMRSAGTGDIQWQSHYSANLPFVLGDGGMLSQMICHLLANALDAMPQGGRLALTTENSAAPSGEMTGRSLAAPGKFICLTVRDTGCGIPSPNLSRIFEPFFTTKNTDAHSGLGLSLVYGIVKQHQGWAEVSSQAGEGTTVKVFLPALTKSEALLSGALAAHELPVVFEQTEPMPEMAPEMSADAVIFTGPEDNTIWVNPAFSPADMIADPMPLARVALVDLNELLRDLVKVLRRLLDESIEVMCEESPDALWVRVDASKVGQAVMNLCLNARDAMGQGGSLTLAATPLDIPIQSERFKPEASFGRFVCLTVTDTGCGLDKAALETADEPAFAGQNGAKAIGSGPATVYEIARQHSGWVEVDSVIGWGSSFRIYLPRA
ncbi:MAG: ATP-binding protein [Limisphaerales bacterium]